MNAENTAFFSEESLDDIFELDIRVTSLSDQENEFDPETFPFVTMAACGSAALGCTSVTF